MENKFDLIEKYLMDEMSVKEQTEFENLLRSNPELMKEFRLRKEIDEAIQENDIINLRHNLNDIFNSTNKVKKLSHNPYVLSLLAAFLVVIVVIASLCGFPNKRGGAYNTAESFYKPYPAIMSFRSPADRDKHEQLMYKAFNYYDEKNFVKASIFFDEVLKNDTTNNMAKFYLAICDIENHKLVESEKCLNDLISRNDHIFWEQSHWYLAMVYLQKNDIKNAKVMLNKIVNEKMAQQTEAEKLLKILN